MIRIAIIFHRFGAYHLVRLNAVSKQFDVVGIETSGVDETYAWDMIFDTHGFVRSTLFPDNDAHRLPTFKVVRQMARSLDKFRPQVVVVPGWASAAALGSLLWCLSKQIPSVVMSESTAWDEKRNAGKEFIKRQVVGLFSAGLAGGAPHSDYLKRLGMSRDWIFLGYDAVDNDYFSVKAHESRRRKAEIENTSSGMRPPSPHSGEVHLPDRYFLASNRFIEKKNLPRLLQAYARYRELLGRTSARPSPQSGEGVGVGKRGDVWDLVVLGDGLLKDSLLRLRSSLGLDACVYFPGFKQYPDLPAYYANAGAFVHASTTEQWGLVVNEAMASGLPVLVSNRCGCAMDLVKEGVNGFTFDPYNVEQLAELMVKISAFNFPRSAFGSASQRIISNWGPDRFAAGLKAAVEKALEVGPIKPTWLQRMILAVLLLRVCFKNPHD